MEAEAAAAARSAPGGTARNGAHVGSFPRDSVAAETEVLARLLVGTPWPPPHPPQCLAHGLTHSRLLANE